MLRDDKVVDCSQLSKMFEVLRIASWGLHRHLPAPASPFGYQPRRAQCRSLSLSLSLLLSSLSLSCQAASVRRWLLLSGDSGLSLVGARAWVARPRGVHTQWSNANAGLYSLADDASETGRTNPGQSEEGLVDDMSDVRCPWSLVHLRTSCTVYTVQTFCQCIQSAALHGADCLAASSPWTSPLLVPRCSSVGSRRRKQGSTIPPYHALSALAPLHSVAPPALLANVLRQRWLLPLLHTSCPAAIEPQCSAAQRLLNLDRP